MSSSLERLSHNPVRSSSVGCSIKTQLSHSGINTAEFTAPSVRGAGSKALSSGVSIQTILLTGYWAKESTFGRFTNVQLKTINLKKPFWENENANGLQNHSLCRSNLTYNLYSGPSRRRLLPTLPSFPLLTYSIPFHFDNS